MGHGARFIYTVKLNRLDELDFRRLNAEGDWVDPLR